MKNFKRSIAALAVATTLGMSANVFAANNAGTLKGLVTDANKTVIAGATVTIKNSNTGFTRTVIANDDGSYRFPSLPIGEYTVTTTKAGYESETIENISVRLGETSVSATMFQAGVERIAVTGSAISAIDTSTAETALNIGAVELARIPVPRDVTSVALLAPGTTRGDSRFGGASFGGSSVAENSTYINGLNVTNFRNGLGFSNVPYEFYETFQVKTGGYSAEFGRSTGGVVNAVTKSGSNEFAMGGSIYTQPESMRENSPSVRANDGTWYTYRDNDSRSSTQANIWASGAIIEDTLFYYAIYNPRDVSAEYDRTNSNGNLDKDSSDNAFWGAKIDWNISDNHRLEFLAFSDENETVTDVYTGNGDGNNTYASTAVDQSGGQNWSVKYTGYLTDDLTMSVLYGENSYDLTTQSSTGGECELVGDYRVYYGANSSIPVGDVWIGCSTTSDYFLEEGEDTREAFRMDFEWVLGDDHLIRFGFDNETNTSFSNQLYSGPNGAYWLIYPANAGTAVNDVTLTEDIDYIRSRERTVGGSFETTASAFYIEDTWAINDNLTATIGLRNEAFDNKNASGETFAKIDSMIAPRLGLAWDVNGDGDSKAFINVGRYFLPVANNTNVRLAGNERDVREYYELGGLTGDPKNAYTLGAQIGDLEVISSGETPDTRSIVSNNLDSMYQDEIIIGYQTMVSDEWSAGIKYTNRSMNGAIDDMIIDHAYVNSGTCAAGYAPHQYVLGNPGKDMEIFGDTDCDGEVDGWMTFSAEDLVYPEAERTYDAIDLNLAKQWDDVWAVNITYTWSKSRGNAEGMVKSDNGQTDAGLTTDWDFPELMDGAYGYLPNDRRHNIKVYGSVAITDELTAGFNFNIESGRPINATGLGHPNYGGEVDYGDTYWLANDTGEVDGDGNAIYDWTFSPRGSMGRLGWQSRLDLNLAYNTELMGLDTSFKIDVFNVFNAATVTRVDESAEGSFAVINDYSFGRPLAFQTPRYVQLSASFKF